MASRTLSYFLLEIIRNSMLVVSGTSWSLLLNSWQNLKFVYSIGGMYNVPSIFLGNCVMFGICSNYYIQYHLAFKHLIFKREC